MDCHADHIRSAGSRTSEKRIHPGAARISSRSSGSRSPKRQSGGQRPMSCTASAGEGSGPVECSNVAGGIRASAASSHSTDVQPAFGLGRNSRRCSRSTTVRWSTCWANGAPARVRLVSVASTGAEARRLHGGRCELLVIVTSGRRAACTLARMTTSPSEPSLRLVAPPARGPSLVLVAGSGRSGTSLFSGILQRLGYAVAQPEVPADETNPRGFAETQWVVDFHTRLLRELRVQVADARPGAWALTAEAGLREEVRRELRDWLAARLAETPALIVKDPRLSWFLPLWRACAQELGADPAFVTMLRHPAAVVDSKQRWYHGWQGDVGRLAGWVNQTVYVERATRGSRRAFVRYEELLEDWTQAIGRVGAQLELAVVHDATPAAMRRAHEFVDHGLSRSRADWQDLTIPVALREQADELWELAQGLAVDDADAAVHARLDELRTAYGDLYGGAEAIAQSSIAAARVKAAARPRPPAAARALAARVPDPVRRRIPVSVKASVFRRLSA